MRCWFHAVQILRCSALISLELGTPHAPVLGLGVMRRNAGPAFLAPKSRLPRLALRYVCVRRSAVRFGMCPSKSGCRKVNGPDERASVHYLTAAAMAVGGERRLSCDGVRYCAAKAGSCMDRRRHGGSD